MTESNFQLFQEDLPPLWEHQTNALTLYRDKPAWLHQWDPRCGKTRETLEQIDYWLSLGVKRILVIAPKTGCGSVWGPEIALRFPVSTGTANVKMVPLYLGTTQARKASIKR